MFTGPTLIGAFMLVALLAFLYLLVRAVLSAKDENVHARFSWRGFSIRKGRGGADEADSPSSGSDADKDIGEPDR